MPRVSVVTPTYNHAAYIRECVASVQAQTFIDWEMLIVDDGSTDGTADLVAGIDDPRVRLFREPNRGIKRLAETYNLALSRAKGDLIGILEGDDLWPADKLATQVPHFDDPDVGLVSGYTEMIDEAGTILSRAPSNLPREHLNHPIGSVAAEMLSPEVLTFTFPVATLLRRSVLERIGGFRQPDDLPLVDYPTFLAMAFEGEFRFADSVCGYWRRHPNSTTHNRLSEIFTGCYREAMRVAKEHRPILSEPVLDRVEMEWERFQASRCTLLGRMLADEGHRRLASRAFALGRRYRRPRLNSMMSEAAVVVTSLGLPVEWLYRLAGRPAWQEAIALAGDRIVVADDVHRQWPVYRWRG